MIAKLRARVAEGLLDPNPILVKELRATFRTPMFARFLYLSVALTAFVVLSFGALIAAGDVPPADVGQIVFNLFFAVAVFLLCLVAPGYASAAITGERERETWESLELSGMSPWRVVLGKLAAAYASIGLVLVALSPVVGIAFLFGGVSPAQVLAGFFSLLVILFPALAYGLALSAHLRSTRASIGLSTITYFPLACIGMMVLAGFGEMAHRDWGLAMEGPFFYTEAFATRLGEWDTWALLVALPLFAFGMPVWFLLASAVSGVRPQTEDKSGPLKAWALAMALSSSLAALLPIVMLDDAEARAKMAVIEGFGLACLLVFFALVFCADPPIPSRAWERATDRASALRRALRVVGPGAAGTLRFGVLLLFGTSALFVTLLMGARRLLDLRYAEHAQYDASLLAVVGGSCVIAFFALALAGWLRVTLKSSLAARVLTVAVLFGAAVLPLLFAVILERGGLEDLDRRAPLLVHFSAFYPGILSAQIGKGNLEELDLFRMSVPLFAYGLPGLGLWALVEAKARKARAEQRQRMKRFEVDAERLSSMPPLVPRRSSAPHPPRAAGPAPEASSWSAPPAAGVAAEPPLERVATAPDEPRSDTLDEASEDKQEKLSPPEG